MTPLPTITEQTILTDIKEQADYLGVAVYFIRKHRANPSVLPGFRKLSRKIWQLHVGTYLDKQFKRNK